MRVDAIRVARARRPAAEAAKLQAVLRSRIAATSIPNLLLTLPWRAEPLPPPNPGAPKVRDVLHPLEWLAGLKSLETRDDGLAVSAWERQLWHERKALDAQFDGAVRVVATEQAKYARLLRRLDRDLHSPNVRQVCESWRRNTRKGRLDVSEEVTLALWLDFLIKTGIPASQLVLRVPARCDPALLDSLTAVPAMQLGCHLEIDEVDPDHGYPACYLLISSQAVRAGELLPPAALSMVGFNTLFVAASIVLRLRES